MRPFVRIGHIIEDSLDKRFKHILDIKNFYSLFSILSLEYFDLIIVEHLIMCPMQIKVHLLNADLIAVYQAFYMIDSVFKRNY
jgi:hypothetical protein